MINGIHPNTLMNIQDKPTITKPSLASILVSFALKKLIRKPINAKDAPGIRKDIILIVGSL